MDIIRYRTEVLRYQYHFQTFSRHLNSRKLTRQAIFCVTLFSYNKLPLTLSPGSFLKKLALIVLKVS